MPREYGKNWFSMWTDEDFCTQPRIDKLLYNVLLAQPAINYAGVQPINLKRWRKALRDGDHIPTELEVKAALVRMHRRAYVLTDDDTGETLVRTLIRNDGIDKQAGTMVSALRSAAAVESPVIAAVLLSELHKVTLPEVKKDGPVANRLRESLKQQSQAAVAHLTALSKGLLEPYAEPFLEDFPEGLPEDFPRPGKTEPSPEPFQEDSHQPPVVVEVEVNTSPSVDGYVGEARARDAETGQTAAQTHHNEPPPDRCPKHINDPDPPACGACAGYRRHRDTWHEQHAERERRRRADFWAEVTACPDCDDRGYTEPEAGRLRRCPRHDWKAIQNA